MWHVNSTMCTLMYGHTNGTIQPIHLYGQMEENQTFFFPATEHTDPGKRIGMSCRHAPFMRDILEAI